jgi:hypothetical protein
MPKSALIMTCPLCGTEASHDVLRILPRVRELPPFEELTARKRTGQAAGYRIRVRRCTDCRVEFETVELPRESFDALLREFARIRKRNSDSCKLFESLRVASDALDEHLGAKRLREIRARLKKPRPKTP